METQYIKRQVWEIQLNDESNGFDLQNEIKELTVDHISPVLDQICNDVLGEDRILKIDRLVLDLGRVPYDGIKEVLIEKIGIKFSEELEKKLQESSSSPTEKTMLISVHESELEVLEYFLNSGVLPWWASTQKELNLNSILKNALVHSPERLKQIVNRAELDPVLRKRFVYQFSEELLKELIQVVDIKPSSIVHRLISKVTNLDSISENQFNSLYILSNETLIGDLLSVGSSQIRDLKSGQILYPQEKLALIRHFMYFGEWHVHNPQIQEIDPEFLLMELCENPNADLHLFLVEGIKNENFRKMICRVFSEEVREKITALLVGRKAVWIKETLSAAVKILGDSKYKKSELWLHTFEYLSGIDDPNDFNLEDYQAVIKEVPSKVKKWRKVKTLSRTSNSIDGSNLEVLTHFVRFNSLPDWLPNPSHEIIEMAVLELLNEVTSSSGSGRIRTFFVEVLNSAVYHNRLLENISQVAILNVIKAIYPKYSSEIQSVYKQIKESSTVQKMTSNQEGFQSFIRVELIRSLTGAKVFTNHLELHDFVLKNLQQKWESFNAEAEYFHLKNKIEELEKDQNVLIESILKSQNAAEQNSAVEQGSDRLDSATSDTSTDNFRGPNSDSSDGEYYIENSGLVIIAPYLDRFFDYNNWIKEDEFVSENAVHRAIHSLQYIVTGKQNPEEFYLPLNKLICGMEVGATLPRNVKLTKKEKESCDDLLNAVMQNWEVMKNTSPDGFRQAFLEREGKLSKRGNDWLLVVEQKTHDVLMNKLPWSLGMLKLPWMKNMINTEW